MSTERLLDRADENQLLADYLEKQFSFPPERVDQPLFNRFVSLSAKCVALFFGYASTAIFVKTALDYPNRNIAILTSVGCAIAFGSFFAEGLMEIINRIEKKRSDEEKKLRGHSQSKMSLTAMVSAAIFFGIFAQFGLIESSELSFDHGAKMIGILSMVGSSGPLIVSMLDTFTYLREAKEHLFILGFEKKEQQTLLKIKKMMIRNLEGNLRLALSLNPRERKIQFNTLCGGNLAQSHNRENFTRELATNLFMPKGEEERPNQRKVALISECFFRTILMGLALSFIAEQSILSYGSAEEITSISPLVYIAVLFSVSPWLLKAFTTPYKAWHSLFNQLLSLAGIGTPTTFVEEFHPFLSKPIDLLSLGATSLTYTQVTVLAGNCCYDRSTPFGKMLIGASMITVMSFFYWSVKKLAEKGVMAIDRGRKAHNLSELIDLIEKVDGAKKLLHALNLEDLRNYLSSLKMSDFENYMRELEGWQLEEALL